VAGGGDLLTAILAGQLAQGAAVDSAFQVASRTAQEIIAASASPRDLALLENLGRVAALADRTLT
jgi:pyridoxal/pyridoxine/pyridoxamine kinase